MDMDIITPNQTTVPKRPFYTKRWFKIACIAVGALILLGIGWYIWQKRKSIAPQQSLENLRLSSGKDTKTIEQKSATMNALEQSSKKSSLTQQQQLQALTGLEQ